MKQCYNLNYNKNSVHNPDQDEQSRITEWQMINNPQSDYWYKSYPKSNTDQQDPHKSMLSYNELF